MLIPLGHEQMSARRWPVVTFALLILNVLVFLGTHWRMEEQGAQLGETKAHLLLLAAAHPELALPPSAQPFVEQFQQKQPALWKQLQEPNRPVEDGWDAHMRMSDEGLQDEMDSLAARYATLSAASITEHYAFIPAESKPLTYLTANFLHGGWLHLIGNLWFLWLAGFVLEDIWGRVVYALFYLLAGVAALQFYSWTNPGSMVATLGASGAIAALMGAFLVRFPKLKIEMAWIFIFFLRVRLYRFKMRAYWLLPMWLLLEVLYGSISANLGGVAHWAHVGGFLFGMVGALALRYTGLEHKLSKSIEAKVSVVADPEIAQASDFIDNNQPDDAIALLNRYVATHADSIDAWMLLQHAQQRKGDLPAFYAALRTVCDLHLKHREPEAAWHDYEDFLQAGGKPHMLAPATRLELCRFLENEGSYDRALHEYEGVIANCAQEKQGVPAMLAAARLCLKRLNRPQDALKFFQAAKDAPVPHLDWEPAIEAGIREAKAALTSATRSASAGA